MNSPAGSTSPGELISKRLDEATARLREQLAGAREALSKAEASLQGLRVDPAELRPAAAAEGRDVKGLARAIDSVETGGSQVAILNQLMTEAVHFAARVALFIARGDNLSCWAAAGFTRSGGITDEQAKSVTIPLRLETVLKAAADGQQSYRGGSNAHADNDQLFSKLGGLDPVELCAIPIRNKGRVAAVFYADSGGSQEGIASVESLDILVKFAGMSVELLPLRAKPGAPATSQSVSSQTGAPQAAPQAPAPAPAPAPQPAPAAPRPAPSLTFTPPTPAAPAPAQPAFHAPAPAPAAAAATGLSPEEQKLHDAAKRFARLLVSEIKLYNEAKVVEGRKNKDLYQRLKDDIDRSRQMYSQRVSPKIASSTNYFWDELVGTLGEGDAAALSGFPH